MRINPSQEGGYEGNHLATKIHNQEDRRRKNLNDENSTNLKSRTIGFSSFSYSLEMYILLCILYNFVEHT